MCVPIRHSIQQIALGRRGDWHYFRNWMVQLKQTKKHHLGKTQVLFTVHPTCYQAVFNFSKYNAPPVFCLLLFNKNTPALWYLSAHTLPGPPDLSGDTGWIQNIRFSRLDCNTEVTKISLSTCASKSTCNQSHRYPRRLKIRNTKVMYKGRGRESPCVFSPLTDECVREAWTRRALTNECS